MSAPTKRRHALYYLSFPLVTAIVFLLVAQLAAWQRAEIVAELADRVAHHETHEASAALRQLAAMPRPPLDVLVAAATSADPNIAEEAQRQIAGLLRRWKRQLDEERGVRTVARRLSELAVLLAREQANFDSSDHRWLVNTSRRILKLSNRVPPGQSPLVAAHCDSILAAIGNGDTAALAFAERDTMRSQPVVTPVAAPSEMMDVEQPSPALLERAVPDSESQPLTSAYDSLHQALIAAEREAAAAPSSRVDQELVTGRNSERSQDESADEESSQELRDEVSHVTPWFGAADSPWRAEWSHPFLRTLPEMPIKASRVWDSMPEVESPPSEFFPIPANSENGRRVLMRSDSRKLLERWLDARGSEAVALEEELASRGFGRLSARLVQKLVAHAPAERLQLVDEVLVEPGIDARPWLIVLADDADADVRLLAVTVMATSGDAMLLEKAWEVAINDHDPRIADLASRLRERRDTQQR